MSELRGALGTESQPRPYTYWEISRRFTDYIEKEKPGLKRFYGSETQAGFDQQLRDPVTRGLAMTRQLMDNGCPREISAALSLLALYDLVVLIDDSLSMGIDGDGSRVKKTLSDTLRAASTVYSCAENAGITAVRFLNTSNRYFNVIPEEINALTGGVVFEGPTDIGNKLRDEVLANHVTPDMKKPLLVVVFTDAEIEGEVTGILKDVIRSQAHELREKYGKYGTQAVAYQFAKIGNHKAAQVTAVGLGGGEIPKDNIESMDGGGNKLEGIKDDMWKIVPNLLLGAISNYWDSEYGISDATLQNLDDKLTPRSPDDEDDLEEDSDDIFTQIKRKNDLESGDKNSGRNSGSTISLPTNKPEITPRISDQSNIAIRRKSRTDERYSTGGARPTQGDGGLGTSSDSTMSPPSRKARVRTSRNRQTNISIPPRNPVNDCTPRSPIDEAWPMHDGIGSMFSKLGMIIRDYRRELVL